MSLYLGNEQIPSLGISMFGVSSVNGETGDVTGLATEEYVNSAISAIPTPDMSSKQDKLTGIEGQMVGFDADGNAVATDDYKNAILLDEGALKNSSGKDITEDIKAIVSKEPFIIEADVYIGPDYGYQPMLVNSSITHTEVNEAYHAGRNIQLLVHIEDREEMLYLGSYEPDNDYSLFAGQFIGSGSKAIVVIQNGIATQYSPFYPYYFETMVGADEDYDGLGGLVPAPVTGDQDKFLKGDGTWGEVKEYTHPTTSGNKHIPSGGSEGQVLKWSADGTAVWDDEAFIATYGTTTLVELKEAWNNGKTPILLYQTTYYPLTSWYVTGSAADSFLFADTYRCHSGGWVTSTPSWHGNFTGATSSAAGKTGLVPAPAADKQNTFLKGDGTWAVPTDTVYTHPTTAGNKHIPSGGSSGQILKWSSNGTAVWEDMESGGINIVLSETEPSNLFEGDYWNMVMTSVEPPYEIIDALPRIVEFVHGTGYRLQSVSGNNLVEKGGSFSFTVVIENEYETTSSFAVKVNGTTVSASNGIYTITNITDTKTVTVTGVRKIPPKLSITGTGNSTYCYATVNGTKYSGAVSNIEVTPGDTITFGAYGYNSTYSGYVTINGSTVLSVTDRTTKTYNWTIPDGVKTINITMSYTSTSSQRRGNITVTAI